MKYKRGYLSGHKNRGGGYTSPKYWGAWYDINGRFIRDATNEEVETQEYKRQFIKTLVVLSLIMGLAYFYFQ